MNAQMCPIATAPLPNFRKGVHCTKVLHPLTRAVRAVQRTVRFSTLRSSSAHNLPRFKRGPLHRTMNCLWPGV